ncbi:MAG: transporter substrate-binding domain-containing protein [Oscillospiraceae bacterium]|nr:transporter substrate-binding domain-containing protein [Oscillospiraceae bacterium]
MKKIKLTAILAMFAMCFALIAGCSGNNAAAPNTGPGTVSGGAEASDMEYIRGKGKMTIGYTVFEPMNYTDDGGNFTGFDTEFALAVCGKLGVDPDFVEINWDTKEIELEAKSIDCVWNGMTITPERAANMSITLPYVKNAQVIVVKAPGSVTSTADLIGKTVVAEVGSAGEMQIIGSEDEEAEENLAKANYISMAKQTDCLVEVKAGTADACVLDRTLAETMVGEGTDFADLVIVKGIELAEEEYGVAFRKGSDVTVIVDEIIIELVRDGTMTQLAKKYELLLAPDIHKYATTTG